MIVGVLLIWEQEIVRVSFYYRPTVDQLNLTCMHGQISEDVIFGHLVKFFGFVALRLHHCSFFVGCDVLVSVGEDAHHFLFLIDGELKIKIKRTV